MIVGKIWDSEFPWDVRVEKVCDTLTAAGHEVHLVCRNRRREPVLESRPSVTIHRLAPLHGLLSRWDAALSFPAFVNPRWYRFVRHTFAACRADVILCRDLPLAPLALAVGRALKRPVMLDISEHYPGMLADLYNARDFRVANLLVRNPVFARWLERLVLPRAAGVLVVVEEMAERLVSLGVPRGRITVVSNTPRADRASMMAAVPRLRRDAGQPLRMVYLGNIEYSRGLDVVIEAVARLAAEGVMVRFDVYGDGKGAPAERRRAQRLGVADRVIFHGHQPYDEVLAQLPRFDAGIIPHHAIAQCSFTVPNKLFDCMAAGLPVIVSSMPPSARITESAGAGLVFRDRDPEDLARIVRTFPVGEAAVRMGEAGRRAVAEQYTWDRDAERLVAAVERAAGSAPASGLKEPRAAQEGAGSAEALL